jgi:hypothetical protein
LSKEERKALKARVAGLKKSAREDFGVFRTVSEETKEKIGRGVRRAYAKKEAAPYVIESVLKRVDTFIEQRELGTM